MTRISLAVALTMSLLTSTSVRPLAVDEAGLGPALVDRFLARRDEPMRQYKGTRRLEARNSRFKVSGWLEAETELRDGVFNYRVLSEGGSAYIRNKVLRRALEGEKDLIAKGDPAHAAFTRENYEFTPSDVVPSDVGAAFRRPDAEAGVLTLLVRPLRKDVLLIDGALVVTEAGDLVRVEGRLSKSPSFWTRDVMIVRAYGRIAGVRVPLGLESTAKVRIAGTSTLTMRYWYESVNGKSNDAAEITAPASIDKSPVPAGTASDLP